MERQSTHHNTEAAVTRTLELDQLRRDDAIQPRVALNAETIEDYAAQMALGADFPPVVVVA